LRRIYRYLDGQLGFQRISRNCSPLEFLGCVFPACSVVSCLSVKVTTSFHALSTNSRGSSDTLLSDLAYTMSQDAFLHGLDDALACRKSSTGSLVPQSLLLGAILQECNKRTNSMRVVQGCARIPSRRGHAHTSLYCKTLHNPLSRLSHHHAFQFVYEHQSRATPKPESPQGQKQRLTRA
jgi:hypothetical protein